LGKEGGRRGIGGDDPLIPKDINKNTPRSIVDDQIRKIDDEIKRNPKMRKERIRKLRAWQKVARRGFTKVVCPPFLEDIVLELSREQCLAGDPLACQTYLDLGGEVDSGGT
jgi:hypothetical protein